MYLARYAFDGDPARLLAGYNDLHDQLTGQIELQIVVERRDGLDVYDACPNEERFREFSTGTDFVTALAGVGLPAPRIEGLGTVAGYDAPHAVVR
jgi:hypothetical protein